MTRPRFLAVAGPAEAIEAAVHRCLARAPDVRLEPCLRSKGLAAFMTIGAPVLEFCEGRGLVLGRLFPRGATEPLGRIDSALGHEILASRGQVLVDLYWGDYFAIGEGEEGPWALRDPSGALPLYRSPRGDVLLLFSDPDEPLALGLIEARLDPAFTAQWLAYPALRTARTGLADVAEVLPGVRVCLAAGRLREESAWTPWRFAARRNPLADFDDAAAKLRRELARTVPALAAGHDDLLLELSGGLDSALVAAALRNGGLRFTGVNFATSAPDGDERHYARAIAERTGAPLAELHEYDTAIDLAPPASLRPRPAFSPVVQPLHRAFADHARAAGAGAFLTGTGGDNVFCYLTTAAPILDALWSGHPWRAVTEILPEVAAQCDCTVWTAARFAAARLLRRRRRLAWKRNQDFLLAGAVPARPDPHPWLEAPRRALPGKREHVEALVRIQHFLDPANREADLPFLHPLMAQPLLELCLSIPSWLWVRGGYNRAVARAAFEDLLPQSVVDRRTKGRLESMCGKWFASSRDALREVVLDGALRRDGIVDGEALELYLRGEGVPADERYFRIFELAAVELWLAGWRGRAAV